MLAGVYILVAGWREPQRIVVKKVGRTYTLTFKDSKGVVRHFESEYIGYGVTVFDERTGGLRRFVVKGQWDQATYRDHSGKQHEVRIHAEEEID